jgi:MbtH protein
MPERNEPDLFMVIVNHEEQYAVWPVDREPPAGYRPEGGRGTLGACHRHIRRVWTDLRPRSFRAPHSSGTEFKVVVNDEEQHAVWPALRDPSMGWREVGRSGSLSECQEHIWSVWTDLRPLSIRWRE